MKGQNLFTKIILAVIRLIAKIIKNRIERKKKRDKKLKTL